MLKILDISGSALHAQRQRMNTIAGNIANVHTTRNADGEAEPYQRRLVKFFEDNRPSANSPGGGVRFEVAVDENSQPRKVHQPGHPDADADGYVQYPNINLVTEFVNALEASRAYEANVSAIEMTKEMAATALRILA